MKRKTIKRKHSTIKRATLTFSIPDDLKKKITTEKGYSNIISSLIKGYYEKKDATPQPVMSPEEREIRNALKERQRLTALYGDDKVYDVEYVIRKGHDGNVEVENWHDYRVAKGVEDLNGYFEIYEKYTGQHSKDDLYNLWHDVEAKFRETEEKEHETALNNEVANGMTLQEALDKLNVYVKRRQEEKVKKLIDEANSIKDLGFGALTGMKKREIQEEINVLTKRFEDKKIFYADIINALGLSYADAYQKVAPALRREGYTIMEKGKKE